MTSPYSPRSVPPAIFRPAETGSIQQEQEVPREPAAPPVAPLGRQALTAAREPADRLSGPAGSQEGGRRELQARRPAEPEHVRDLEVEPATKHSTDDHSGDTEPAGRSQGEEAPAKDGFTLRLNGSFDDRDPAHVSTEIQKAAIQLARRLGVVTGRAVTVDVEVSAGSETEDMNLKMRQTVRPQNFVQPTRRGEVIDGRLASDSSTSADPYQRESRQPGEEADPSGLSMPEQRRQAGVKAAEIAEAMGCSGGWVSAIEKFLRTGEGNMSDAVVSRYASTTRRLMDASLEDLDRIRAQAEQTRTATAARNQGRGPTREDLQREADQW